MDGLDGAFVDRQFIAELVFHIGYDLREGVLNDFFRLDQLIPEDQLTVAQAVANARIDLVRCAIMERRYCQADFFRDLGITGAGLIIAVLELTGSILQALNRLELNLPGLLKGEYHFQ